jgi:hypothetical protein
MFGDNNDQQHNDNVVEPTVAAPVQDANNNGDMGAPAVPAPLTPPAPPSDSAGDYLMDDISGGQPTPAAPVADDPAAAAVPAAPVPGGTPSSDTDELLSIKQQALTQLTPLVGHLDQDPEEKFRTTMMMIQASDNDSLIKTAYEAAQAIPDEKARAQALLDIVNEINYFTQNAASSTAA